MTPKALLFKAALAVAALCGLSACSTLPSSGPGARAVLLAGQEPGASYRVVDLDANTIGAASQPETAADATLGRLGTTSSPTAADAIQVGDALQVVVYEVGAALFGTGGSASSLSATLAGESSPVANAQTLPPMIVAPDGFIALPYVGRVQAVGRRPREVASDIERGLRGKSQSPQVVVTVREDVGNVVMVMGDIKSPGRKPLGYRRESLLDMIAMAGGPTNAKADSIVRLTRAGSTYEASLGEIHSGSPSDVKLEPQDRIEIIFRPRTFTAFGATGRVSEIPFQSASLSLAEALARMGGPLDQQADPTGIFVFRTEPSKGGATAYRINLKDPKSYLLVQQFQIRDKDLIYVSNARANAFAKLLNMIGIVVNPIVVAKQLSQ